MRRVFFLVALAVGCSSEGSSDTPAESAPIARFVAPSALTELDGDNWFNHPWPSDFRKEGSAIRLDGMPNPRQSPLLKKYFDQLRGKVDGFSLNAAGYFSFEGPLDESSLPKDERSSLDPTSTLQLIDIDDKSPSVGKRHPIYWKFRQPIGDYYLTTNTLSWAPSLGHPLRPRTRYAAVVTTGAKGKGGNAAPNKELQAYLEGKGPLVAAWGASLDELGKAGITKDKIAHLTVFTTNNPVEETLKVAEHARALPPPKVKAITFEKTSGDKDQYTGVFESSPDYQEGTPPFLQSGGGFVFGTDGKPVKQRDFELRFKLVVPNATKCPMPISGYPIVLYAHGTTGDWESFIDDGTATHLAAKCVASMGVDQIFHGTRPGAPALTDPSRDTKISLAFFNLENAIAARTNSRQSAIDEVARGRLVASGGLDVPADVATTKSKITFDPKRIGFYGHSQGGLNGALLLAVDDTTRGGVLSGAGSAIAYSLLLKVKPDPSVAGLVKAFLGVTLENEDELGPLHPAISLVQTCVDPADPVNYYGAIAKAPFAGHVPKSVLMTEGVAPDGSGDNYAPPRTIEAGAIAGGFPLVEPVVLDIPEITKLDGIAPAKPPIKGNAAMGKATVGIAQFEPPAGSDGHFVVFRVPRARSMSIDFSASLLTDEVPTISSP